MQIRLNGEPRELAARLSVAALVREVTRSDETGGIAVAVNADVVPRGEWADRTLVDGDVVELLRATAGG